MWWKSVSNDGNIFAMDEFQDWVGCVEVVLWRAAVVFPWLVSECKGMCMYQSWKIGLSYFMKLARHVIDALNADGGTYKKGMRMLKYTPQDRIVKNSYYNAGEIVCDPRKGPGRTSQIRSAVNCCPDPDLKRDQVFAPILLSALFALLFPGVISWKIKCIVFQITYTFLLLLLPLLLLLLLLSILFFLLHFLSIALPLLRR